jgi:uncharacterized protein (TIGR02145 family)
MANFRCLAPLAAMLCISLLFSCSSYNEQGSDIAGYRTRQIGEQVWMAENLNYNVSGSVCYDNSEANCDKYGRLYNWATAMALPSICNTASCISQITAKHRGICPEGWHIPSDAEWKKLVDSAGGSSIAGRYLKATSGWNSCGKGSSYSYQCEDKYGFSAMPGGIGYSSGNFYFIGEYGYWWSTSEYRSEDAYYRDLHYLSDIAGWYNYGAKSSLLSVRCLHD